MPDHDPAPEVVCVGEALVDFIPLEGARDPAEEAAPWRFVARPGGAPANVAAGLARLGRRVAFVGRVGADPLGRLIADALDGAAVDTRWTQHDPLRPTTVAIVMPATESHTRFLIYRQGSADAALEPAGVPLDVVRRARLVHAGTLSLAAPASRRATLAAVDAARDAGVAVSVDVNLRPTVWRNRRRMAGAARDLLGRATRAKLTRDELAELDLEPADMLDLGATLVVVTDGEHPAEAHTRNGRSSRPAIAVPVIDPTGAGDAFMAAFLDALLDAPDWTGLAGGMAPSPTTVEWALERATAAGAFAVARVGAMESLPTRDELAGAWATASG